MTSKRLHPPPAHSGSTRWGEELVSYTGSSAPFLGNVIPLAQAVLVLMVPEDVVHLHPDLHTEGEDSAETRQAMQARPNVLLELGMALAIHPDRTIIVTMGSQRAISDIGGRNYIRITDAPDFRAKIANRLRLAGCPVETPENGPWLTAGDFSTLIAHRRSAP